MNCKDCIYLYRTILAGGGRVFLTDINEVQVMVTRMTLPDNHDHIDNEVDLMTIFRERRPRRV